MKFVYEKTTQKLVPGEVEPEVIHRIRLQESDFQVIASSQGLKLFGETPWFQQESGEIHLPVDDFREFMARLASAADLAWKEIEAKRVNQLGPKALLSAK